MGTIEAVCTIERPSPTQMQVLAYCAQGMSRDEIGRTLYLSPWTVKQYLDRARSRLDASNVTHAVAICMARGYLCADPLDGQVIVAAVEVEVRELAGAGVAA